MIFIFSGPSGVGKSTIIDAIRQKRDFQFSVSYTSRNIREGEYNGEDYNFVTEENLTEGYPLMGIFRRFPEKTR